MDFLLPVGLTVMGYLMGSIPNGMLMVRLTTGKDIRQIGSGRTGGTNAMRAGGSLAGLATGILDVLKSLLAVGICRWIMPGCFWLDTLVGLAAVIGHNYSIFSIDWKDTRFGRIPVFHGGAGAAPTLGAAVAFWFPSLFIILPVGLLVFLFVGYASVTTLVSGLTVIILFSIRAALGYSSKWYVVFGVVSLGLMIWSLRPNIDRLIHGTERVVGLRALWQKRRNPAGGESASTPDEHR
ncbi:MAG: glycerol-3-phosphate acyltransferase [Anaerolineales bacterium]|nr:glycerol-3-phosphate acyltransferase [Anaerolineales bacterium]